MFVYFVFQFVLCLDIGWNVVEFEVHVLEKLEMLMPMNLAPGVGMMELKSNLVVRRSAVGVLTSMGNLMRFPLTVIHVLCGSNFSGLTVQTILGYVMSFLQSVGISSYLMNKWCLCLLLARAFPVLVVPIHCRMKLPIALCILVMRLIA